MESAAIKQIILFHPMKFVCKGFTEFSKKIGTSAYTLDKTQEFSYLLDELKPELLFIHCSFLENDLEFFKSETSKASFKPQKIIIIGKEDELESLNLDQDYAFLVEPYDLSKVDKIYARFLAESH